jgi:hypothetical protein
LDYGTVGDNTLTRPRVGGECLTSPLICQKYFCNLPLSAWEQNNQNFPKLEGRAPSRPMRQLGHDGACPSTARNFGDFSRNGEVLQNNAASIYKIVLRQRRAAGGGFASGRRMANGALPNFSSNRQGQKRF